MKLGLISYDCRHLKTEQLINRYLRDTRIKTIEIFALPFVARKMRQVIFHHRPDMLSGASTKDLGFLDRVSFTKWDGEKVIGGLCDIFVIAGAGILDINFAAGKPILNVHPGIIPTTRGLDSFKWAIFSGDPIGNSLHIIDSEVDKGQVLKIVNTPVYASDTVEDLASRHYNMEISLLADFFDHLKSRVKVFSKEKPAKMRMPQSHERIFLERYKSWREKYSV